MMIAKIGSYSGVFHDLIVVPSGSETYHLVDEDLQGSTTPGDCKSADGKPFSFDVERIARQYESTSKQIYASPGLAVILEADTGLEEAQFTSAVLWTNPGDLETNYGTDLHGANIFAANGDIRPDATYKFAAHGSQVFNVLASASALPSGALSNAYRIAMAKVTRDQAPFDVNAVAITDSFRYARAINAAVLNLSVVASQSLPGLEDGLRAASFVVVSAAGNNGKDVQSAQVFPPAMNSSRDKLIVVGAHDWVNDWATFSNWGPLVDLLAPGCAVPLSSAGNGVFVYGTSFAAPFVSLTAALLKSLHLTPQNIKNRILASVDFDPRLVYKVKSGGSLNAEDALAFTTDILVLRGANGRPGTRLVGEFGPNDRWECTGDGPNQIFSPSTVTRIVTGYPVQGGSTNFEVAARAHGSPLVSYCKSMSGKVNFRLTSTDAYQPYGWNEIWSVLPRCRAYGGSIQLTC